jgi:hypothetical protein
MKIFALTCSAATALLLTLGVDSSQAENCQDLLTNNRYRCHINGGANLIELCFQFISPGTQSPKFDVVIDGPAIGCTCKATGKVEDPDLDASKEFFCVQPIDLTHAQAFGGKVSGNGKKIKDGFTGTAQGGSGVLECELDPNC